MVAAAATATVAVTPLMPVLEAAPLDAIVREAESRLRPMLGYRDKLKELLQKLETCFAAPLRF
jgi:hypothetical protein